MVSYLSDTCAMYASGCILMHSFAVPNPTVYMSSDWKTWTSTAGTVERNNYQNSEAMSGIIAPTGADSVTLVFSSFNTEEGYDFVTVKSCTTIYCSETSLLGEFSGSTIPGRLTSNTGIMLIEWSSDYIYANYPGWSASWTSLSNACEIAVSGRVWLREGGWMYGWLERP